MTWFSLWLPVLLQLVAPVGLVLALWVGGRRASTAAFVAAATMTLALIVAIGVAGLWLVLPWYLPWGYGALLLGVVARVRRRRQHAPAWPASLAAWSLTAAISVATFGLLGLVGVAIVARQAPETSVDLAMPFAAGTYLVVNGGGHSLVNAHLATLTGERFAPYRGQSYGVDLVRLNRAGLRAPGVLPADPAAYVIFGTPVLAPCEGRVVAATDGLPDLPPPEVDRAHLAGNHVILTCGEVWVVLGHLQRGSVAVREADRVARGQALGRVGNSGNTGEPHLHLHAQRPGTASAPLSGAPLPVRINGRSLARNDRLCADGR